MGPSRRVDVGDVADDVDVAAGVDGALPTDIALDHHVAGDHHRTVDHDRVRLRAHEQQRAGVGERGVARGTGLGGRVVGVHLAGRHGVRVAGDVGVGDGGVAERAALVLRVLDVGLELGDERHLHRIGPFVHDRHVVRGFGAAPERAVGVEARLGDGTGRRRRVVGADVVNVAGVVAGAVADGAAVLGAVVDVRVLHRDRTRRADLGVGRGVDEAIHRAPALEAHVAVGAELAVDHEPAVHPAVVVHEVCVVEDLGLSRPKDDALLYGGRRPQPVGVLEYRGRDYRHHCDRGVILVLDVLADPHPHAASVARDGIVDPREKRRRVRRADGAAVGAHSVEPVVRLGLARRDLDGGEVRRDVADEATLDLALCVLDRRLRGEAATVLGEVVPGRARSLRDVRPHRGDDDPRHQRQDERHWQDEAGSRIQSLHGVARRLSWKTEVVFFTCPTPNTGTAIRSPCSTPPMDAQRLRK